MEAMLSRLVNKGEVNNVNALTERVKKRRQKYFAAEMQVCAARSKLVTESWKATEGQPIIIRSAKAFEKVMEENPIAIWDDELIIGSQTKYLRGGSPPVEWGEPHLDFVKAALRHGYRHSGTHITEEDAKSLSKDMEYWKDKNVGYAVRELRHKMFGNFGTLVDDYYEARLLTSMEDRQHSSQDLDYETVLKRGLSSIVAEAREELEKLTGCTAEEVRKVRFLEAGIIALDAAIKYAKRHAELARELAKNEDIITRKQELERIAEVCEWVPANPARTFHEALQATWFMLMGIYLEGSMFAETVGRLDQYLYRFYENDIREGKISRQEAAELLACFWIKLLEKESIQPASPKERTQGSQFVHVTIAGVKEDGTDATNELSWLILEVARQLKVHQPHLTLRYHDGLSEEFLIKALETNRDIGAGIPQFVNDEVIISRMLSLGIPLKDARNNEAYGCSHPTVPAGGVINTVWVINTAKIFELALYDGKDPRTGKQLGLPTGDPRNFASYEELYEAFKKQFLYSLEICAKANRLLVIVRGEKHPLPFTSVLATRGIKKAKDLYDLNDGSAPHQLSFRCADKGHVNISDSLTAIKRLVFEEKKVSMAELLDALEANFEGKEDLRQILLAAPKYGNDDDEADQIMKDVYEWTARMVSSETNAWGKPLACDGRHGTAYHVWAGKSVGALPDGRMGWTHLADGGVSPMTGLDTKGPTAVINSATKMDHTCSLSGVLNQKFPPWLLQTRDGLQKVLALVKTHFEKGGIHIQFNILDRETLLDAKKHPERHKELLVRVAGYSARFVDLASEVQDEIIDRTEQSV